MSDQLEGSGPSDGGSSIDAVTSIDSVTSIDGVDEVGSDLRRAITRLYSRFLSERTEGEVTDAALFVLIMLEKRDRMSLTDLAEAARVTLGSMSQTVKRIEDLGYATKTRATDDRRKVAFTLTTEGAVAVRASRQHRRDWLNGQLAELTAAERRDIARVAPLLLRIADS